MRTRIFRRRGFSQLRDNDFGDDFFTRTIIDRLGFGTRRFERVLSSVFRERFVNGTFQATRIEASSSTAAIDRGLLRDEGDYARANIVYGIRIFIRKCVRIRTGGYLFANGVRFIGYLRGALFLFGDILGVFF